MCYLVQMKPSSHRGVYEKNDRGGVSVITRSFYTGTSGIILRSSLVISRQGTWDF